jgi:probable F420-dependent oxidoreductase
VTGVRFGFTLAPYSRWRDPEELAGVVVEADRLGFDHVGLPDHVAIPAEGEQPRSGACFYDVFSLASFLAARTSRIRFVVFALVVPLRHPLELARQVATVDQLSGGRIGLVAGTGWLASEFAALGVPFEARGPMTDEWLAALTALWTDEVPAFTGRHVSFPPMTMQPSVVQRPRPPIWIGGTGTAPFRRVIEHGDGWAPMTGTFDERAAVIAELGRRASEAGRDPGSLAFVGSLTVGPPSTWTEQLSRGHHVTAADRGDADARRAGSAAEAVAAVRRAADAGFTHLELSLPGGTSQELLNSLRWFADEVFPQV